jgi:hypothetical protein
MNTITISVSGEELETINIELSAEEVSALYRLRKEQATKIAEIEKELKNTKQLLDYAQESRNKAQDELSQAHTLMSALGILDKTTEEESYSRKTLSVTTRIALYIAKTKEIT